MTTPCRCTLHREGDAERPRPEPGKIRISQAAMDSRMRRIFTPNVKGEYKVSAEIVKQRKNKKISQKLGTAISVMWVLAGAGS